MTSILTFAIFLVSLLCLNTLIQTTDASIIAGVYITEVVTSVIWLFVIISIITSSITEQISRITRYKECGVCKTSYKVQLVEYMANMKTALVDEYKVFEETLMKEVSDSNLLAAQLKDNSYSKVLIIYNDTVRGLLNSAHKCDRDAANYFAEIEANKSDKWSYGYFIPTCNRAI